MKDSTKTKGHLLEEVSILRSELSDLKRRETEWKQAEEAAQQARSLLISILESTADGILVVDNNGKVIISNKKFLSLWRIPESLAAKQDDNMLLDYVLSQLKEPGRFIEQVKQLYSQPEADSFDILEFKDGRVFERISRPQRLGNDIGGRVWSFRDVTDRWRAEEEQRRNREAAERLAEEMAVIAEIGRVTGSTLNIEEVYERFAEEVRKIIPFDRIVIATINVETNRATNDYMAGVGIADRKAGASYTLEGSSNFEVVRTKSSLLIQTEEDFDEYKDRFPRLLSTFQAGFRSIMTVPLFSKGEIMGALLLRSFKPHAYTDKDVRLVERVGNQIAGAIVNAQLFAEAQEGRKMSLRESEGRFRALVEQAAVGVAEIDMATGRFLTVNRRLCEMVGRTEEEMLATTFPAITHPEDLHLHEEKTALLLAGKIGHYSLEKRYLRKDGAIIWVNITVSPLWKPGETPGRNMIVVEDITERKRVQEENERHSKQTGRVARNKCRTDGRAGSQHTAPIYHPARIGPDRRYKLPLLPLQAGIGSDGAGRERRSGTDPGKNDTATRRRCRRSCLGDRRPAFGQ